MKLLVVIAGPTAIGKTAFAIALAKHFNTVILSADSRQIFKETTIGTAKPSAQQLNEVPHYFINHISIAEAYNAGKYEAEAMKLLAELFSEKDIIILCGGSGLYIDAVCKGFDEVPKADDATRKFLADLFATEGITALQQMLQKKDPDYFQQVDLNNPQRIMRALEVCLTTEKSYSSFRKATVKTRPFEILKIALNIDRAIIYERINTRVDTMMNDGLLKEAEALYPFRKNNALQTVGYEELFQYFEAKHTLAEAVNLIKQNTRHYAKRQLTWFNKDKTYHWLQPHELQSAIALIEKTLQP
jgi:tRNA dimethylallyltransferase